MSNENTTLEKLLRAAGELSPAAAPADALPERVWQALTLKLDAAFPRPTVVRRGELERVILRLLESGGLESVEVARALGRQNITCHAADGDGMICALLNKLEGRGLVEGRWRETGVRMVKTYHLTERGGQELARHEPSPSAAWNARTAEG